MNVLKKFAKNHNLAMLLIHHTSKMDNPNDPFFSISETRGLTGAPNLMIKKDNALDNQAKLYIKGRDVDSDAFAIEIKNCKWVKVGSLADIEADQKLKEYRGNRVVIAVNALKLEQFLHGAKTNII